MAKPSTTSKAPRTQSQVALEYGFRSGLEEVLARQIAGEGLPVIFEEFKIPYRVEKDCTYKPDFVLPNGIVVESKGRFVTADRQKHLLVKEQHPDLDLRFVFSRSAAFISKTSSTTYAMWCEKNGFDFSEQNGRIPRRWLEAPPCPRAVAAVRELFTMQGKKVPF